MKKITFTNLGMAAIALVALFGGCDCPQGATPNGTATITYEQLGACNGYREGNNVVSAGGSAAYVLFKIISIDNKNGKVNFSFDPTKLYITSSDPKSFLTTNSNVALKIGVLGTTSVVVNAGKDVTQNGYGVIVAEVGNSTDPQLEANKVNYFLSYDRGNGDPTVFLDKKNSKQVEYPLAQDCMSRTW